MLSSRLSKKYPISDVKCGEKILICLRSHLYSITVQGEKSPGSHVPAAQPTHKTQLRSRRSRSPLPPPDGPCPKMPVPGPSSHLGTPRLAGVISGWQKPTTRPCWRTSLTPVLPSSWIEIVCDFPKLGEDTPMDDVLSFSQWSGPT